MGVLFRVTGITILWGALENVIAMTACAFDIDVLADQRVGSQRVIHAGLIPTIRGVALGAILAQATPMLVIFGMA